MGKLVKEIKIWTEGERRLWNNSDSVYFTPVKITFNYPITWTIFSIEELKQILREWIKGEELRYPQEKGFKGRWLLFEEIKKVFDEV